MLSALFPLLLLATSLGSGLYYQKTNNDIFGVLALFSALICLIWGLVLAHWAINLLALLFLLKLKAPIWRLATVNLNK